jgi:hypothetical protein
MVFKNSPDLEFGCFSLEQLVQAMRYYEEDRGLQELSPLDLTQFSDARSGRELQEQYCSLRSAPSLKGKTWGKALMRVAFESDAGETNKLYYAWACVLRAMSADYDYQRKSFPIDPDRLGKLNKGKGLQ